MVSTPHLLVGAALATKIHPLILAAILAILSHYVLDAIPHWDYSTTAIRKRRWKDSVPVFLKATLDFSLGILIILLLAENRFSALSGAFFAVLPDAVTFLTIVLPNTNNRPLKTHHLLHNKMGHWHKYKKIPLLWKLVSQLTVAAMAIYFLISH